MQRYFVVLLSMLVLCLGATVSIIIKLIIVALCVLVEAKMNVGLAGIRGEYFRASVIGVFIKRSAFVRRDAEGIQQDVTH